MPSSSWPTAWRARTCRKVWRYDDPQPGFRHPPAHLRELHQPRVLAGASGCRSTRPFHTLSHALDYRLFGAQPAGFTPITSSVLRSSSFLLSTVVLRPLPPVLQAVCGVVLVFSLPVYVMTEQLMLRQYLEGGVLRGAGHALFKHSSRRPIAWALSVLVCYGAIFIARKSHPRALLLLRCPRRPPARGLLAHAGGLRRRAGCLPGDAGLRARRHGRYQARLPPSLAGVQPVLGRLAPLRLADWADCSAWRQASCSLPWACIRKSSRWLTLGAGGRRPAHPACDPFHAGGHRRRILCAAATCSAFLDLFGQRRHLCRDRVPGRAQRTPSGLAAVDGSGVRHPGHGPRFSRQGSAMPDATEPLFRTGLWRNRLQAASGFERRARRVATISRSWSGISQTFSATATGLPIWLPPRSLPRA